MKAGPFHALLLSTLLSLFSHLVFYPSKDSFWQKNLLVRQNNVMKNDMGCLSADSAHFAMLLCSLC